MAPSPGSVGPAPISRPTPTPPGLLRRGSSVSQGHSCSPRHMNLPQAFLALLWEAELRTSGRPGPGGGGVCEAVLWITRAHFQTPPHHALVCVILGELSCPELHFSSSVKWDRVERRTTSRPCGPVLLSLQKAFAKGCGFPASQEDAGIPGAQRPAFPGWLQVSSPNTTLLPPCPLARGCLPQFSGHLLGTPTLITSLSAELHYTMPGRAGEVQFLALLGIQGKLLSF